ncbi:MAG: hypothetical protein LKE43_00305 [Olsenella sp.]|nr:hypothetical protein [Olsenella sp.]
MARYFYRLGLRLCKMARAIRPRRASPCSSSPRSFWGVMMVECMAS